MEKLKKYSIPILGIAMLLIGIILILMVNFDNKTIQNKLIADENILHAKIDSNNIKIVNLYKYTDSLSISDLISLKKSGLNLQIALSQFQNEKENEIRGLYLSQIKYWSYLIAALTVFSVFLGLDWNISNKINKLLAKELKKQEQDISRLIDEKSWEFKLMKKAHIIIANPNIVDDNRDLSNILKWFHEKGSDDSSMTLDDISFDNPNELIGKVISNMISNRFNILLLENSDGKWNLNNTDNITNAKNIAKNLPKDMMLIYFGPRDAGNFPTNVKDYLPETKAAAATAAATAAARGVIDRISFVNAPSKLYSNIIDTLKYMDIIN